MGHCRQRPWSAAQGFLMALSVWLLEEPRHLRGLRDARQKARSWAEAVACTDAPRGGRGAEAVGSLRLSRLRPCLSATEFTRTAASIARHCTIGPHRVRRLRRGPRARRARGTCPSSKLSGLVAALPSALSLSGGGWT